MNTVWCLLFCFRLCLQCCALVNSPIEDTLLLHLVIRLSRLSCIHQAPETLMDEEVEDITFS